MRKFTVVLSTILVLLVVGLVVFFSFLNIIPEGNVGVLTQFGAVTGDVIKPGAFIKLPWQSVVDMNVRQQMMNITTQVFTKDMQTVDVDLSAFYSLNPESALSMFKVYGKDYSSLIEKSLYDSLKNTFGQYNAEELVSMRESVGNKVNDAFAAAIAPYGLQAENITMNNFDFSDAFEAAIEAKTVAAQKKLQAETEQEQQTMIAEAEAERARISAQAEADKKTIAATAEAEVIRVTGEAEAAAISAKAAALTENNIRMAAVEQWDGKLPVFGNSNASPIPLTDITNLMTDE